jgi:hypothetical protein
LRRARIFPVVAILAAFLLIAMPLSIASSAASSSSSTTGYVSYQVTLNGNSNATSVALVINESSTPTNQNGFDNITVGLVSSLQNFSFSKIVNTTSLPEVLPFIPGITNQSFTYSTHGVSIGARISIAGSSPISFNGTSYNGQVYSLSLSVTNSSNDRTLEATGTAVAFPSGLLYSVHIQNPSNNSESITVQLLATNLPLKDPTSSASTAEGAAMVGAGILAAAAIAVPWKFRRKKNTVRSSGSGSENKDRPSYWVD